MAKYHTMVFRYQSLTDAQRKQLQEINSRYVSKLSVVAVDEEYHYIAVTSGDENVFEEAQKAVMQLKIAGLRSEWLNEEEEKESLEHEFLAKVFGIRKIN